MKENPPVPEIQVLDKRECWSLLRDTPFGRLAVVLEGHPEVFPVNFRIHEEDLVFRTAPGSKLRAASGGAPATMEIDGVDTSGGVAWSVVAKGRAAEVERSEGLLASVGGLFPWAPGEKDHFVRLRVKEVTGRRFTIAGRRTWDMSLDEALRSGLE